MTWSFRDWHYQFDHIMDDLSLKSVSLILYLEDVWEDFAAILGHHATVQLSAVLAGVLQADRLHFRLFQSYINFQSNNPTEQNELSSDLTCRLRRSFWCVTASATS